MKENSIEKLQERLETLHVIQDARLACNADDLDIREEIAEVEEEIKELQDDTNVNRENSIKNEQSSIEENIKLLEKLDYLLDDVYSTCLINDEERNKYQYAIDNILSDYKRVLKIKEVLLKENEELNKNYNSLIDKIILKIDEYDYKFEKAKKQNKNDIADYYWDLIINFKKLLGGE